MKQENFEHQNLESADQERKERKQLSVVLVDLQYPYGKNKIYLNGSLCAVAGRLISMGHRVRIVDLNIDSLDDQDVQSQLHWADIVGVSVIGPPYMKSAREFANKMKILAPQAKVAFGGVVIKKLEREQFEKIFQGTGAIPIQHDLDFAQLLECKLYEVREHDPFRVSYQPVWENMGDARLKTYLQKPEMTLVLGQGCGYDCNFCAADKDEKEQHRATGSFASDVRFLAESAKRMGIFELRFYASSLDFFQHPQTIVHHLEALAKVRQETGVDIKTRCLSCLISFVNASKKIEGFADLLQRAGLYCVGFGVDGTEDVWNSQNKGHNRASDISICLDVCKKIGLQAEILLVMGYSQDTVYTLRQLIMNALQYMRHRGVVIRPYVCKSFVPGNEGWQDEANQPAIQKLLENPDLFYNLDFSALASKLTHPRALHRFMTNSAYVALLLGRFLGRCPNSFLVPQGGKGVGAKIAKKINTLLPTDR